MYAVKYWIQSKPLKVRFEFTTMINPFSIIFFSVGGNAQKVRVKLVDFGVQRVAAITDIGRLDDDFAGFPIQSINLCLLNLLPWNRRSWNENDTRCVTKLLGINGTDNLQNRHEMHIQFEMQPNLTYSSNLCSPGLDYVEMIISKGIARKNISTDFFHYIKNIG